MKKKRAARLKRKKAARRKFLATQRSYIKWARAHQADYDYAVFSKPEGGKWQVEFNSPSEACRDTAFEILKLRTDIEVRRVNV